MKLPQIVSNLKLELVRFQCFTMFIILFHKLHIIVYVLQAEEILGNPATSGKGGVYYYSERGDRLIDLASLRDKLWQVGFFNLVPMGFSSLLVDSWFVYNLFQELPIQNSGADSSLLFQKFNSVYPQLSNFASEVELNDVRETIQQLLRWGWKYNKNLEEQAAQLHLLTGWSQIVEVDCFLYMISYINS